MIVTPSLRRQHAEILQLCDKLTPMLEQLRKSQKETDLKKVISVTNSLLGKVMIHLSVEDKVVYPLAIRSSDPLLSSKAKELFAETGQLKDDFNAFKETFLSVSKIDNIGAFVKTEDGLLSCLKRRIYKEDAELYPLMEESC